jgi:hypothetical protein
MVLHHAVNGVENTDWVPLEQYEALQATLTALRAERDRFAALCAEAVPLLSQVAAMLWQHGMGWEAWALKAQDLQARMSGNAALARSVAKRKEVLQNEGE